MKSKAFVNLLTGLILGLCISACSGEDGMDGEMGPQGPQGEQGVPGQDGVDGQDGADGQDGMDGNANVVASDWFELQFDDISTEIPPTWGNMYIENDEIPIDMVEFIENGGAVLMYYRPATGGSTIMYPLPYGSSRVEFIFLLAHEWNSLDGALFIRAEAADVTGYENDPGTTFRYVLVPANAIAHSEEGRMPSYEESAALYGFKP